MMWRSPVQSMDDLKIAGKIGQGKTSEVFLAKDCMNNNYAVKKFWADESGAEEEARILTDLGSHPRLPRLYWQDSQHLVMDLNRNGELFDYISVGSDLFNEELARFYFCQLIDVLEFVHINGYAHRDIKPENILLDEHFNIKLTDFGFATPTQEGEKHTKILGTDGYMAPELLKAKPYDAFKADIFSLGVVLFCMVSGFPPYYEQATEKDPYYRFFAERRSHVYWSCLQRKFNKSYSSEFMSLATGLLAFNPSERFGIETIKTHPWYTKPCTLTNEDIFNRMAQIRSQISQSSPSS